MNTIYNTFVNIESQEQCNRLKELCIDKGLNYYWNDDKSFLFEEYLWCYFLLDDSNCFLLCSHNYNKTEVTEEEFIKLLQLE